MLILIIPFVFFVVLTLISGFTVAKQYYDTIKIDKNNSYYTNFNNVKKEHFDGLKKIGLESLIKKLYFEPSESYNYAFIYKKTLYFKWRDSTVTYSFLSCAIFVAFLIFAIIRMFSYNVYEKQQKEYNYLIGQLQLIEENGITITDLPRINKINERIREYNEWVDINTLTQKEKIWFSFLVNQYAERCEKIELSG